MMKRVVIVLASAISSVAMGVGGYPGGAWAAQAQSPLGDQALGSCLTWGESPLDRASLLGSPRRPVNGVAEAGVVLITPRPGEGGTPMTLSSSMLGLPDQRRGWFGAAVAAMDMTSGDECDDLVIGMPGASGGRGAVAVVPDFGNGLEPSAAVWLPTAGLTLQPGDRLGAAITARSRLIVAGAPGRDAPGARDAGALVTWWVLRDATVASRVVGVAAPVTFVQGSGGVLGHADPGDRFGSVLWSDFVDERLTVVVGVPDEDIGRRRDAGAVALLEFDYPDAATTLDNNYLLWQGSGLPGRSRSGDRLGAAVWYSDLRGAFGSRARTRTGGRTPAPSSSLMAVPRCLTAPT